MKDMAAQPRTRVKSPIAILKAVAKEIIKEPLRYDQSDWGRVYAGRDEERPPCGTTGCVAGWVMVLTRPAQVTRINALWDARSRATSALGLTGEQASALFHGGAVAGSPGTVQHAKAGVRHIERFMRTELGYTGPQLPLTVGRRKT